MKTREQEIIEGLRPVCQCKGIRQKTFVEHIRKGTTTLEGLQKATGAGSGSCMGKRCTPRIQELLEHLNEGNHGSGCVDTDKH
jgi:NAD(P)H-nitrite reductase large subunit